MTALVVALTLGAIVRLTRLVTGDTITKPIRDWAETRVVATATRRQREPRFDYAYLLGCPWCASIYVGALVAPIVVWFPTNRIILAGLIALTGSLLSGHIQSREPSSEDPE